MFIFGHIGITLGIFFGLSILVPRLRTIINPTFLAIGALLPDLIDKPLGRVILAHTLANGRIIGHTLLFSFLIFLIGLYLYDKRREIIILNLATGSFFHLIEDQMWNIPKTLFWPLFGWSFPRGSPDNAGIRSIIIEITRALKNTLSLHFSSSYMPEFLGMLILAILFIHWVMKRLRQYKLRRKQDRPN
jgi:membrane-bound metal-dependent hydrolase YbcI (DUF457 family)